MATDVAARGLGMYNRFVFCHRVFRTVHCTVGISCVRLYIAVILESSCSSNVRRIQFF